MAAEKMNLMSTMALLLWCYYYCLVPNKDITMMSVHTLTNIITNSM